MDAHPLVVFGRLLECTECGGRVDLIEIPFPWIDEADYVCGPCLVPVEAPVATDLAPSLV